MAHSTAQGIASLGRHGDDLIVHMNQEEVQGLQALAKQHGTSLTINPKTGMPEAFKLGGVFKALLPIAAGFALGPGGFGLFDSALMTGLAVGAGTGLLTGNLGQGIMAGFGAYGGFGLGDTLKSLAPAGGSTAVGTANTIQAATGSPLVGASSQFISPFTPNGIAGGAGLGLGTVNNAGIAATSGLGDAATGLTANSAGITNQYSTLGVPSPSVSGFDKSYQGLKSLFEPNGFNRAKEVLGTPAKDAAVTGTSVDAAGKVTTNYGVPTAAKPISSGALAMKLGTAPASALLGGVEESDLNPDVKLPGTEVPVYEKTGVDAQGNDTYGYVLPSQYNAYRTLGGLNTPGPLQLTPKVRLAIGGPIKANSASTGYADGGSIQSGGIRDLYGTPDNQPTMSPGLGGFGLGRLSGLASEQAKTQAQTYGYAHGGYLDGQGDGMSDSIPATIEGKQPARLADGEFVVPADVVSHLGNGSSKAGSKRLYAMLNKVRQARTGRVKQGKQINPNKYMPA